MMKRVIAGICFLVLAAACATQPPANNVVSNSNANANKSGETRTAATVSEADIIAREKAAWDVIKKKDWDGFAKTMASDYLEVLDDGVHDKAAALQSIKDFELTDATFADWKMSQIGKNSVLLTYSATVKATFKGQAIPTGPYREAAVYVNRGGEWIEVYYQETVSRTASSSPTPTPSAKASPKATASPAGTPGQTGPDPVANEKLVWDALKSRNFDAFGSYLAPDSIEVEPEGVYDKSGSVKGVSMFDFSKAQQSDWKTLKIDEDAVLVTYVLKDPGMDPDTDYHSTIWSNRNGKWQAVFHQGTPAAKPEPKK
jgi:hypothetical protein